VGEKMLPQKILNFDTIFKTKLFSAMFVPKLSHAHLITLQILIADKLDEKLISLKISIYKNCMKLKNGSIISKEFQALFFLFGSKKFILPSILTQLTR
jgi:hypothetical protein